jgi:anti-sigma-K factor RskA
MTERPHPDLQRLLELLADRAVQSLSEQEQAELDSLLQSPTAALVDVEAFDRAAAALDLSLGATGFEPLPGDLSSRIKTAAPEHLRAAGVTPRPAADSPSGRADARRPSALPPRRSGWNAFSVAVSAACLAVAAVALWWSAPAVPQSVAQRRAEFLETAGDAVTMSWKATEDPSAVGASGDVVWSSAAQRGFMRFRGLAPNDPRKNQYQLWIFDATRDERYPVDGGVFDIPAGGGDVIVEITAKLPVNQAKLFAITVEPPGGVVVSSRQRLPLLAEVPAI